MKVLLHICCAPCSIMCIETLRGEGIEPVGFWDNVNIHPYTEYRERKNTLVEYAKTIGLELVVHGEYGLRPFVQEVVDDIDGRCVKCYRMRFRTAAQYAAGILDGEIVMPGRIDFIIGKLAADSHLTQQPVVVKQELDILIELGDGHDIIHAAPPIAVPTPPHQGRCP